MRYAFGFLWAALRMRLHDVAAPLWMPVDWLLSTESGTHGSIALAVGAQVVYIQYEDGLQAAPGVRLRPPVSRAVHPRVLGACRGLDSSGDRVCGRVASASAVVVRSSPLPTPLVWAFCCAVP
ncbi:hypothetical protein ACFWBS_59680, partial [Streptomyces mirabilis]